MFMLCENIFLIPSNLFLASLYLDGLIRFRHDFLFLEWLERQSLQEFSSLFWVVLYISNFFWFKLKYPLLSSLSPCFELTVAFKLYKWKKYQKSYLLNPKHTCCLDEDHFCMYESHNKLSSSLAVIQGIAILDPSDLIDSGKLIIDFEILLGCFSAGFS